MLICIVLMLKALVEAIFEGLLSGSLMVFYDTVGFFSGGGGEGVD